MYSQWQIFILFFIIGIILGVLFDFFKSLRRVFKTSDIFTTIEDIIYLILVGLLISLGIFKINDGEIRLFIFIGIFLGTSIYSLTMSNLCVIILYTLMSILKKSLYFLFSLFKKCYKNIKNIFKIRLYKNK